MAMTMPVVNPATLETLGEVPSFTTQDVDAMYERSRAAFQAWRTLSVEKRLSCFTKLRHVLVEHFDDIARQIAEETGKVQLEALTTEILPVLESIRHIEKHAAAFLSAQKAPTPILFFGKSSYVEYKPRGVVLVIAPWNFPLQLTLIPMLNALIGGNTVLLKPSEVTPRVGQIVESLFHAAGFPEHVVQVAHGGEDLGAALVDGQPDYIFFTGSVRTGRMIQAAAAERLIPTTLELGGKDPMIVFADAPLERAVQGALWGGLLNAGQVCTSVERVYVERPLYDKFVDRLVAAVQSLHQGSTADDDVGSMTFAHQVEVVRDHLEDALAHGATLRTGKPPREWITDRGLFIAPMVVTGVTQDMRLMREETFGPVLPVLPFDTEEEAIDLANDSSYGLSSSIWTKDVARGRRVASRLVTGNAHVNDVVVSIVNHDLPFGGEKSSGIGRYHSADGLRMFCTQTSVMVDKGAHTREVNWFPYSGKYELFATLIRSYYGPTRKWGKFLRTYLQLLKKSGK